MKDIKCLSEVEVLQDAVVICHDGHGHGSLDGEIIVDGESLACLLVRNGLVKIYGTIPHTHPEYIVSREKLLQLEAEAKREKVGGWGLVKSSNVESPTNPQ